MRILNHTPSHFKKYQVTSDDGFSEIIAASRGKFAIRRARTQNPEVGLLKAEIVEGGNV